MQIYWFSFHDITTKNFYCSQKQNTKPKKTKKKLYFTYPYIPTEIKVMAIMFFNLRHLIEDIDSKSILLSECAPYKRVVSIITMQQVEQISQEMIHACFPIDKFSRPESILAAVWRMEQKLKQNSKVMLPINQEGIRCFSWQFICSIGQGDLRLLNLYRIWQTNCPFSGCIL